MKYEELEKLERITDYKTTMETDYNGKNIKEVCYYDNDAQEYTYGIFINNIENQKITYKYEEKLSKLQRQFAKKKKGSVNVDNKIIIDTINNINLENIKKFNKVYCFQDDADDFNKNTDKIEMTEKFLYTYLCRICLLYKLSEKDAKLFLKWYTEKGHIKLKKLISDIYNNNIDNDKLKRFFLRYDILLEQTIYEKNTDSLLNILITIPNEVDHSFKLCIIKNR